MVIWVGPVKHCCGLVELVRLHLVVRTTRYCLGILLSGFVNLYIIRIFKPLFVLLILLLRMVLEGFILLSQEFIVNLNGPLFELSGSTLGHYVRCFGRRSLIRHPVGGGVVD